MGLITIKYGNSVELELLPENLTELNKSINDITNVVFFLKDQASQLDEAAPLKKTMAAGQIYKEDNKLIVKIQKVDFSSIKLKANRVYLIAVGVEFNGTGEYFEDSDDNMQRKLKVLQDKVRI